MKKIITLAVILSCTLTSLAYADGPNGNNAPGQQQVWQNEPGHGKNDGNRQQGPGNGPQGNQANGHQDNGNHRGPNRGEQGRAGASQQHRQDRHEQEHFAWNGHDFRKGQPAPEHYRGSAYRINNWHDRGLPAPPQGQHWSYIDGNYVLIAAATGIITSILVNGLLNN
ncbi:Nickel/cobalt homeostasis protein RcnB precursor [Raoultella terrigena]|jgi:Ni/Co efflux regulator RcnB|uniref:Nickel/cobalt homeostasis protein RcnB n=1 Tax=Raoultella terrigena TaxID=577 RepID=A0A7Z8ZE13_RAOTE|nr:Nickel/cobalt homeostasis protein RcnB precursor [Raoultella terrigena]